MESMLCCPRKSTSLHSCIDKIRLPSANNANFDAVHNYIVEVVRFVGLTNIRFSLQNQAYTY